MTTNKRVQHLVVDSSAFIRQAPLKVSWIFMENRNLFLFCFKESNRCGLYN